MIRATGKWCLDCEAINLWSALRCCRCGHAFDGNEPDAPPPKPKEPAGQLRLAGLEECNRPNHEAIAAGIVLLRRAVGN